MIPKEPQLVLPLLSRDISAPKLSLCAVARAAGAFGRKTRCEGRHGDLPSSPLPPPRSLKVLAVPPCWTRAKPALLAAAGPGGRGQGPPTAPGLSTKHLGLVSTQLQPGPREHRMELPPLTVTPAPLPHCALESGSAEAQPQGAGGPQAPETQPSPTRRIPKPGQFA